MTLLTTMLEFSDTGILDVFVDEAHVQMREQTIGGKNGAQPGLMRGVEFANTFSYLRPNDLVWNYVVDNYLKGRTPQAFDLLFWNSDSTNLPGPMCVWYLRKTYLENKLRIPNEVTTCGEPVDLSRIDVPTFIYGSREDHIVPWKSAYASAPLLTGPQKFVLGASGHIAGLTTCCRRTSAVSGFSTRKTRPCPPTRTSCSAPRPNIREAGGPPGRTGSTALPARR